jgi:hypothetical protein
MAYIGRSIEYGNAVVDHFVGNGGATYTLNYDTNTDGVVISLDGVVQKNGTDFNITGTSLVFTSVVASPIEIQVVYTGLTLSFPTPSDGSVDSSAIVAGAVDDSHISGLAASKLTGTIADARFPATLPAISGANLTNLPSDITKSTSEPTLTTNPSGGVGTVWLRTTTGEMYCCTDATTNDNVWTNIGSGSGNITSTVYTSATGGTITTNGNFKTHTFASSGTFQVTTLGDSALFNILTIAGGGSGAGVNGSGGGGAGGFKFFKDRTLAATSYTVTVGGGASGGGSGSGGGNGTNSSFDSLTATGGGGAGAFNTTGSTGGSGGGGSGRNSTSGGAGTANQGNAGGTSTTLTGSSDDAGGGGGGAKTVGASVGASTTAGNGGAGYQEGIDSPYDWEADDGSTALYEINGTGDFYAGGGAGGSEAGTSGTGGAGGGGASNVAGTANTGGGGGGDAGTQSAGAAGGSGVVIIRYQFQ